MWAASSTSPSSSCRRLSIPTRPPPVSAKSQPLKTNAENTTTNSSCNIKSFGHKILSAVKSPNPNRNQTTPKQESESEISGSDVLRALQKASAVKEKNKSRQVKDKNKEGASTEGSNSENSDIDRRVRPLRIKNDWGLRLTDLEKRLQDISETVS